MATVSLTNCTGYDPTGLREAVAACLKPLGGLAAFIKPGQSVLLKPNLLAAHGAEQAVTTHPRLVLAVAEECLRLGAVCAIGDSPGFGRARQVAARCGLLRGARALGVPVVELEYNAPWRGERLSRTLADYDVLISLPKLKAHAQLRLTAALKNTYGLVAGKAKAWRHVVARGDLDRFCRMLLAVHRAAAPALTIVDAVVAMDTKGPRGGRPRSLGLLAAGTDAAAIDSVLCTFLGVAPGRVPLLAAAARHGFGETRPEFIEVLGWRPEGPAPEFRLPETLSDISFSPLRFVRGTLRHLWLKMGRRS
ncbi:MAG: DUF362 domain-containing protein [Pseudomonadota bacterium]